MGGRERKVYKWNFQRGKSLIVLFVWTVRVVRRTEYRLALVTNMKITRAEVSQWKETTDAQGCVTEIKKSIMKKTTDSVWFALIFLSVHLRTYT